MRMGGFGGRLRRMKRLSEIVRVFARHGFADVVDRVGMGRFLPARMRVLEGADSSRDARTASRLRKVFEELGPAFVKLGQMLSTRPDLLPPEYIDELSGLSERVEPVPFRAVLEEVEKALGCSWRERFEEIEEEPLAAGSVAQVHRGRLAGGARVVLKVLRPGVKKTFEADMEVLYMLAALLEERVEEAAAYRPREVVEQFAVSVEREFDLVQEATIVESFRRMFADDDGVKIPAVYWEATAGGLMTMEEIGGRSLADVLRKGDGGEALGRRLLRVFLKQYFEEGMFHGDPHPGNIRVLEDGSVSLLDFGSVGLVSRERLADLVVLYSGVSRGSLDLTLAVLEELVTPADGGFPEALKADVQRMLLKYRDLPAGRISPDEIIVQVVDFARRYRLKLPVELVELARSMTLLFGTIRAMAPGLNVVEESKSFSGKTVRGVFGIGAMAAGGQAALYRVSRLLGDAPRLARSAARKLEGGRLGIEVRHEGVEGLAREVDSASNRLAFSVVVASMIMASSILMAADVGPKWEWLAPVGLGSVPVMGLLGFLFAGFMGLGLAWAIFRSGKL